MLEETEHSNAAPSDELEHSDDKRVTNVHFVVANLSQQIVRVRNLRYVRLTDRKKCTHVFGMISQRITLQREVMYLYDELQ